MISEERKERWTARIEYCIKYEDRLNGWELVFMHSIRDRWCTFCMELTLKQSYKLNDIYYKLIKEEGE